MALLLIGLFIWQWSHQDKSQEVRQLFAEALQMHHGTVTAKGVSEEPAEDEEPPVIAPRYRFGSIQERAQAAMERFQDIADRYHNTQSGQLALYYVALNRQRLGETGQARDLLVDLIQRVQNSEIRNLIRHCLAQLAEIDQDREETVRLLQDIRKEAGPPFPMDTVLMQLAQNHEALGNVGEALEFYKQITADYPSSPHSQPARDRVNELEEAAQETG